jgi:hypothetical protein
LIDLFNAYRFEFGCPFKNSIKCEEAKAAILASELIYAFFGQFPGLLNGLGLLKGKKKIKFSETKYNNDFNLLAENSFITGE